MIPDHLAAGPAVGTGSGRGIGPAMTAATVPARHASLPARVSAELAWRLAQHTGRLGWDAAELAAHQRERLRMLLAYAAEYSPFHARRLRGLDLSRFEAGDLARLPVMTKAQMMAEFDDVVTDRRLSRRLTEQHLAGSAHTAGLLLDEYVCLASGGSSGLRGVFVQTLGEFTDFVASLMRRGYARALAAGGPPPGGLVIGIVAAASPVHSSGFGAAVATGPPVRLIPAPATLPLAQIVARLNTAQPPALLGYASKLAELAREQMAGRLTIAPRSVTSNAEVLTTADRAIIERAFAVPVIDSFVSTEGLVGHSEPGEPVMSFASDMCLAELVDDDNNPVPPGVASAKVLVTNLHNLTQPLIRYELTDRFTRPAGTPSAGWLRASIEGRADDVFRYGGVAVHPHVIRSALASEGTVREYQVRQTEDGVDVTCVTGGHLATAALAARLEHALRQAGLTQPRVSIRLAETITRDPKTGKVSRFVPKRPHLAPPGQAGL
jgi:phenylacetate-CoA ligase